MVGGLQVAGRRLVPAPRTRSVEFVAAAVQLQGCGAHDAGVGIQVVPLSPIAQPASHLHTVGGEEVPPVGEALPAGAHRTRRTQVVPRAIHAGEPRAHDASVGIQVVPLAPVAQPAADLCTVGGEEVPPVEEVLPSRAHRTRRTQVVPGTVHRSQARAHDAGRGVKVVPGAAVLQPAANERPGGGQEKPVGTVTKPAGGHVATVVEVVAATPDPHPLGSRVRSVDAPPPPASRVAHPRAASGLIGRVHRRRFVPLRRGLVRPVLIVRGRGGRLRRVRGLGAGRGRRHGDRGRLCRCSAFGCGLRRTLVPGVSAGLRGQGDEREGQGCGKGAGVCAVCASGRRCHNGALSLENSSPISVGYPSHCAGVFESPTRQNAGALRTFHR